MPSATMAHRSDSMAARKAMVMASGKAALILPRLMGNGVNEGRLCGIPPKRVWMVSTGTPKTATVRDKITTAATGPGIAG